MNDKTLRVIVAVILCLAVITASLIAAPYFRGLLNNSEEQTEVGYSSDTVRAEVVRIAEEGLAEVSGKTQIYQVVEVSILEGEFQKQRLFVDFGKNQILPEGYSLKPGDEILVSAGVNPLDGSINAYFVDFTRGRAILIIFILFAVVAFAVGSWTGLRSLLGMLIGLGVILFFIIPQITSGANPVLISIIGAGIFLGLSLYMVYGWNGMTHSAVISMVISLLLTGAFSALAVRMARLTGFGNENMMFLLQQSDIAIDLRGILLAGIIIGSLGVLDDLVVGQSSAIFQLHSANPQLKFNELFRRALIIGRDHAAASVNTLVLAYAGESLPMLLLFSVTNVNLGLAINISYIAEEVVRALAGTVGLFLSIPISTAVACLWVLRGPGKPVELKHTPHLHNHDHETF